MAEIAERYAGHESFYGWYWPNEVAICQCFPDVFLRYVNQCSAEAHRLTPGAKTLIAPYGTRHVTADDRYIRQLDTLDVDIVAYQDEVGVRKTTVDELPAIFERLRTAHSRVPQRQLWADMEVFDFEGGVYQSSLIPAPFGRVRRQLEAISDFVDVVLIYQYQGLMNKPDSVAFSGHPDSVRLYRDYEAWLKEHHPDVLATMAVY